MQRSKAAKNQALITCIHRHACNQTTSIACSSALPLTLSPHNHITLACIVQKEEITPCVLTTFAPPPNPAESMRAWFSWCESSRCKWGITDGLCDVVVSLKRTLSS